MKNHHSTTKITTPTKTVDIAIIGSGTAGNSAYRQAIKYTDNIVIINDGFWTTVCATVGCMPSKLLIAAAERAHHAMHSENFGIINATTIDGKAVMQRVQFERNRFANFVQQSVDGWKNEHKISGQATITKDGMIAVNNHLISAKSIIIATGSRPHIPEGWAEKLGDRILTSDNIFELTDLPKSLAVVGTGAIGLELAQAFTRLGVQVRIFNRSDRLGGLQDKVVNQKAIGSLSHELDMVLNSTINGVKRNIRKDDINAVTVEYTDQSHQRQQYSAEYILVATGRTTHLDKLGLESLGVELDERNRPKNLQIETGQVANLPVYIIGDANGYLPLLHVASNEGFRAGSHIALEDNIQSMNQETSDIMYKVDTPVSLVFTEPQIAQLGQNPTKLEQAGIDYVVGEVVFDNQGRSRVMGVNSGLLRLYVSVENDKILGASMVAPDAEYIAHILTTAISHGLTASQLLDTPFYHPTILEGLRTALRDAQIKRDKKF